MHEPEEKTDQSDCKNLPHSIAIIGIGCIFPKSSDSKEFWRLLVNGHDAIADIPQTHWSADDFYDPDPKAPDRVYCKRGAFISPVDFDPSEFGIPPSILEATDSSQLLGLVTAKMALMDAGYGNGKPFDRNRASVILGVTGTQELVIPLGARLGHPLWKKAILDSGISPDKAIEVMDRISGGYVQWQENSFPGLLGNVVAGRISNRLDLGGTNCVVDAACASSLSAVYLAMMELMTLRSDMVITGGVDALNDIFMHMCFSKTQILSPTGDVRPFSKHADGTLLGEGIGMVVLKRLIDAQRDNDRIYAVIKGMGTSSDARSQSIYAPRAEGQARALRSAYQHAGINPNSVELIEAHGTGTRVGDAVEFSALQQVFTESLPADTNTLNACAIGSVKSMIGHTKAAAGSAGLIKIALSLYHKVIPPTLKAEEPDPGLNIKESSFYLNQTARPWVSSKLGPRRAGVSAFGFGGSNYHAVLEEYGGQKPEVSWNRAVEIFSISAESMEELKKRLSILTDVSGKEISDKEISIHAEESRKMFDARNTYRLLFVLRNISSEKSMACELEDLCSKASAFLDSKKDSGFWNNSGIFFGNSRTEGKTAFLFPGQGSQYIGMGQELACMFPQALDAIEAGNEAYEYFFDLFQHSEGAIRLSDSIFPIASEDSEERRIQKDILQSTGIAQPAIGSLSLGMMKMLEYFGITPDAACGHSFGELTALAAAGSFSSQDFLRLSAARGYFMEKAGKEKTPGLMIAVKANIEDIDSMIKIESCPVVIANFNSPFQTVLSGSLDAISKAEALCRQRGFSSVRLPVAAAFHSPLVEGASEPFESFLETVEFKAPGIPVISNVTGKPYPDDPRAMKQLLGKQMTHPVQFISAIDNLYEMGVRSFIEVGPRAVLTGLTRSILKSRKALTAAMDSSLGKESGLADLAKVLCLLGASGFPVLLERWEEKGFLLPVRKPLMKIPVSGANYRNPRKETPADCPEKSTGGLIPQKSPVLNSTNINTQSENTVQSSMIQELKKTHGCNQDKEMIQDTDMPYTKQDKDFIAGALRTVQEGLKSMQALQFQTTEAHKLFLQTQMEAGKTLQKMMESTRHLAESSLGFNLPEQQFRSLENSLAAGQEESFQGPKNCDHFPEIGAMESAEVLTEQWENKDKKETLFHAAEAMCQQTGAMTQEVYCQVPEAGIEGSLLEAVSHLTGYPADMLSLDMDIEADLGIDSIKRVEILAALEEKIPGLPSIPPDVLGGLKTLGHIVSYLGDGACLMPEIPSENVSMPVSVKGSSRAYDIKSCLIETVSHLTGYPADMLSLDMDIEADLGIDSIKRVEILAALEERIPGIPSIPPDTLGTLKTLAHIVAFLENPEEKKKEIRTTEERNASCVSSKNPCDSSKKLLNDVKASFPTDLLYPERRILSYVTETLSYNEPHFHFPERPIIITDDSNPLSVKLADALRSLGVEAIPAPIDDIISDTFSARSSGLILVPPAASSTTASQFEKDLLFLQKAFVAARKFGKEWQATKDKGAIFASLTNLDGAFGLMGKGMERPVLGALAGLVKTAFIEWNDVTCRAIDLSSDWQDENLKEDDRLLKLIISSLWAEEAGLEIGLAPELPENACYRLSLNASSFPEGNINLSEGDVVVVTGGARGVTAQAAIALAQSCRPVVILVGRSAAPFPEPYWLSQTHESSKIKQAILKNVFADKKTSPKELEAEYFSYMANREITETIKAIKSAGAKVEYHSADIRKYREFSEVLEKVRKTHGPVRAIIHGAGVLKDRLILDKSLEQFEAVFDTKVKGLNTLLKATSKDPLNYIVLFSSITARIGNRGQADYAMANEALNKIAQREALNRRNCRVISINWGPWDGGMVTGSLKKEFEQNDIRLIPVNAGANSMLCEMRGGGWGASTQVEVVIGDILKQPYHEKSPLAYHQESAFTEHLSLSIKREIDIDRYPVLNSHLLDGKPVVPFALITEWLGHGALHENPGLQLQGLDDIRILKGIRLDDGKKTIRLMAGKTRKNGHHFEMDIEIRDGVRNGKEIIHSRAKAILSEEISKPPAFDISAHMDQANAYNRSVEDVYDKILFHGNALKGLLRILTLSPKSVVASLASAPPPEEWTKEPFRSRWIGDPLVLDAAFQMAIVWSYEQKGVVSLPSFGASYRQYCRQFPSEGVVAVFEILKSSQHKILGDFTFLDSGNNVIARLTGYEAVMNASLAKAFKNR